ncbi:conserved hypothetical protein [Xenorhabdus nematophila F1]|uniref:Uncharacterized protein n=1 Tax=Xenorhabdus nematophila (strain ATCC 19061 / DSM 3370 / CCUG 14189 / LMG 1036 / NCIMB 9965 / AN6) TaxID=406817 RepID=D3VDF9_XENNA|nr:conserved hypothetical protein [Xenorhabdus nematophila ATCC 19061]CCW30623.1 conserved hypothetical protein [Xenorhabdus nematophila F1]CEK25015.1 conserved hypothetical protein [Xenorhabdus nematophila AN6/1]
MRINDEMLDSIDLPLHYAIFFQKKGNSQSKGFGEIKNPP